MGSLKKLHIVSFDNPYPPNYGGVIDVYYKLKALHECGVEIILHAFEYGRTPAPALNAFCSKVYYYQRRNFVNPFIGSLPYIVNTRNSDELLANLKKDNLPILFEGLHTCYFLDHPALKSRIKIVRTHNIEHDYYTNLEEVEGNFFKKYFFSKEATRLKDFENILSHAQLVVAISEGDKQYLGKKYNNVQHITAFHPNQKVISIPGKGNMAFYHGKLSVGENDEAARFLVNKVFSQIDYPFEIAGDKPSRELKKSLAGSGIKLHEHLSTEDISYKIQHAHVNVLPTFQSTGIKLKLINVLFQGRHLLVNPMMVERTGIESLCHIATSEFGFIEKIEALKHIPFTQEDITKREELLKLHFCNRTNAELLKKLIGDIC